MSALGRVRSGRWLRLAVLLPLLPLLLAVLEATAKPTIYVRNDNDKLEPGMVPKSDRSSKYCLSYVLLVLRTALFPYEFGSLFIPYDEIPTVITY